MKFSDNQYPKSHLPTIGVDYKSKVLKVDDKTVKLQIWDTSGQERFKTITSSYYKGAKGVILTYDCSEDDSFENISKWIEQIDLYAEFQITKVLVANKIDLPDRVISEHKGKKIAEDYGLKYFETSAKTGEGVQEVFESIAKELLEKSLKKN